MFRVDKSQDKFYRVCCSNHETVVLAPSFEEAASNGLLSILDKFKNNTNVSLAVVVDRIDETSLETEIFEITKVLENIGFFSLSKKISSLSDFLLDKSKNSS